MFVSDWRMDGCPLQKLVACAGQGAFLISGGQSHVFILIWRLLYQAWLGCSLQADGKILPFRSSHPELGKVILWHPADRVTFPNPSRSPMTKPGSMFLLGQRMEIPFGEFVSDKKVT